MSTTEKDNLKAICILFVNVIAKETIPTWLQKLREDYLLTEGQEGTINEILEDENKYECAIEQLVTFIKESKVQRDWKANIRFACEKRPEFKVLKGTITVLKFLTARQVDPDLVELVINWEVLVAEEDTLKRFLIDHNFIGEKDVEKSTNTWPLFFLVKCKGEACRAVARSFKEQLKKKVRRQKQSKNSSGARPKRTPSAPLPAEENKPSGAEHDKEDRLNAVLGLVKGRPPKDVGKWVHALESQGLINKDTKSTHLHKLRTENVSDVISSVLENVKESSGIAWKESFVKVCQTLDQKERGLGEFFISGSENEDVLYLAMHWTELIILSKNLIDYIEKKYPQHLKKIERDWPLSLLLHCKRDHSAALDRKSTFSSDVARQLRDLIQSKAKTGSKRQRSVSSRRAKSTNKTSAPEGSFVKDPKMPEVNADGFKLVMSLSLGNSSHRLRKFLSAISFLSKASGNLLPEQEFGSVKESVSKIVDSLEHDTQRVLERACDHRELPVEACTRSLLKSILRSDSKKTLWDLVGGELDTITEDIMDRGHFDQEWGNYAKKETSSSDSLRMFSDFLKQCKHEKEEEKNQRTTEKPQRKLSPDKKILACFEILLSNFQKNDKDSLLELAVMLNNCGLLPSEQRVKLERKLENDEATVVLSKMMRCVGSKLPGKWKKDLLNELSVKGFPKRKDERKCLKWILHSSDIPDNLFQLFKEWTTLRDHATAVETVIRNAEFPGIDGIMKSEHWILITLSKCTAKLDDEKVKNLIGRLSSISKREKHGFRELNQSDDHDEHLPQFVGHSPDQNAEDTYTDDQNYVWFKKQASNIRDNHRLEKNAELKSLLPADMDLSWKDLGVVFWCAENRESADVKGFIAKLRRNIESQYATHANESEQNAHKMLEGSEETARIIEGSSGKNGGKSETSSPTHKGIKKKGSRKDVSERKHTQVEIAACFNRQSKEESEDSLGSSENAGDEDTRSESAGRQLLDRGYVLSTDEDHDSTPTEESSNGSPGKNAGKSETSSPTRKGIKKKGSRKDESERNLLQVKPTAIEGRVRSPVVGIKPDCERVGSIDLTKDKRQKSSGKMGAKQKAEKRVPSQNIQNPKSQLREDSSEDDTDSRVMKHETETMSKRVTRSHQRRTQEAAYRRESTPETEEESEASDAENDAFIKKDFDRQSEKESEYSLGSSGNAEDEDTRSESAGRQLLDRGFVLSTDEDYDSTTSEESSNGLNDFHSDHTQPRREESMESSDQEDSADDSSHPSSSEDNFSESSQQDGPQEKPSDDRTSARRQSEDYSEEEEDEEDDHTHSSDDDERDAGANGGANSYITRKFNYDKKAESSSRNSSSQKTYKPPPTGRKASDTVQTGRPVIEFRVCIMGMNRKVRNVSMRTSKTKWKIDHPLQEREPQIFSCKMDVSMEDQQALEYKYMIDDHWEYLPKNGNRYKFKDQLLSGSVTFLDVSGVFHSQTDWEESSRQAAGIFLPKLKALQPNSLSSWLDQILKPCIIIRDRRTWRQKIITIDVDNALAKWYSEVRKHALFKKYHSMVILSSLALVAWMRLKNYYPVVTELVREICFILSLPTICDASELTELLSDDDVRREIKDSITWWLCHPAIRFVPEWILVLPTRLEACEDEDRKGHILPSVQRQNWQDIYDENVHCECTHDFIDAVNVLAPMYPQIAELFVKVSRIDGFFLAIKTYPAIRENVSYQDSVLKLLHACELNHLTLLEVCELETFLIKALDSTLERGAIRDMIVKFTNCLELSSATSRDYESVCKVCDFVSKMATHVELSDVKHCLQHLNRLVCELVMSYHSEDIIKWNRLYCVEWNDEEFSSFWKAKIRDTIGLRLNLEWKDREEAYIRHYIENVTQLELDPVIAGLFMAIFTCVVKSIVKERSEKNFIGRLFDRFKNWTKDDVFNVVCTYAVIQMKEYSSPLQFIMEFPLAEEFARLYTKNHVPNQDRNTADAMMREVTNTVKDLISGSLTADQYALIKKGKQEFLKFCSVARLDQENGLEKAFRQADKKLQAIAETRKLLQNFLGMCNMLRDDEKLDIDVSGLEPIARSDGQSQSLNSLKNLLSKFNATVCNDLKSLHRLKENKWFWVIWNDALEKEVDRLRIANKIAVEDNVTTTWELLLCQVWVPTRNRLFNILDKIIDGTLSMKELTDVYGNDKNSALSDVDNFYWLSARYREDVGLPNQEDRKNQIETCLELRVARHVAAFLGVVKELHSLKGDFSQTIKFENMQLDGQLKDMSQFTSFGKEMGELAPYIGLLNEFVSKRDFIKWLKRQMKGALRTFCDLAMKNTDDADIDVDKIRCLMTAVTNFSPLIFELAEESGVKEAIEKARHVCRNLGKEDGLIKKWVDSSDNLKWYEKVANLSSSIQTRTVSQVKDINKNGTYTVTHVRKNELNVTIESSVELLYTDKDGKVHQKSHSELQDLHSKLMLISERRTKRSQVVEQFTELLTAVENLASVYVQLLQSGCMLFDNWSAEIRYDESTRKRNGDLVLTVKFEGELFSDTVKINTIGLLTKVLHDALHEWKEHIHQKRLEHYFLNEYSTQQLTKLCKELAKSVATLPDSVYMLLSSVAESLTVSNIQEALSEVLKVTDREDSELVQETPHEDEEASDVEKMKRAVRSIVRNGFAEDAAKAAVQIVGFDKESACVNWIILHEREEMLINSLRDEFNETIECAYSGAEVHIVTSVMQERSNKTIKDVIRHLHGEVAKHDKDIISSIKTVCKFYNDNTTAVSLQDYLNIEHLGKFLQLIRNRSEANLQRILPDFLENGKPNLVAAPKESTLSTVLSLYMKSPEQMLPTASEVLICSKETSCDEVERFFMRAMCKRCRNLDDAKQEKPIFCLAFAHLLSIHVSQAAEAIFNEILQSGRVQRDYQLVILTSERQHYLTMCFEKHHSNYLCKTDPDEIKGYLSHHLKVIDEEKSAASVDPQSSSVKLVWSSRSGVGKSLHIQRVKEELNGKMTKPGFSYHVSTIRLMDDTLNPDDVISKLTSTDILNEDAHLIHLDITPAVKVGLESFAFRLIALGSIEDSKGRIWRRNSKHLYLLEFTEYGFFQNPLSNFHIFNLVPRDVCVAPDDELATEGSNGRTFGMDEKKFKSETFQRPYQYLKRYSQNNSLDEYVYEAPEGSTTECLDVLLKYCSVKNPSWAQLHYFAEFLNLQLKNCESSVFCTNEDMELQGLKALAIHFMILMAQDFATPSLSIADKSQGDTDMSREYHMRRRWEDGSHPFVFFNEDKTTMTFLNVNIDAKGNLLDENGFVVQEGMVSEELVQTLMLNYVELDHHFDSYTREEKLKEICKVMGVSVHDPDLTYELTNENVLKILAIYMRLRCNVPVILIGETGCGKTRMMEFLSKLLGNGEDAKNLITVKVHGGSTSKDIFESVHSANKTAKDKSKKNLQTILFFDEANTTQAIYAIKEAMCDRTADGFPFEEGLHVVAACNPYKKLSKGSLTKLENAGLGYGLPKHQLDKRNSDTAMRALVYRVVPLPPSMQPFVWDFGQLDEKTEVLYIRQMAKKMLAELKNPVETEEDMIVKVLSRAQCFVRDQKDECRFVSLRDVERCLLAYRWFSLRMELLFSKVQTHEDANTKGKIPRELFPLTQTIGVCYHASLDNRKKFREAVISVLTPTYSLTEKDLLSHINACQKVFLQDIKKGSDIASNDALRENVFMMAVCLEIGIPLYIIGKPGSSKSLAKTIIDNNMHGNYSHSPLFRQLKQVQMVSYQCSAFTDTEGIEHVFKQCRQLQSGQDNSCYTACVVLDEIGLAEDSPSMPLKILHPLLETGFVRHNDVTDESMKAKVGFIGISNWSLDPAKMNRGIFVSRGAPGRDDLLKTTEGIFSDDAHQHIRFSPLIKALTEAYLKIYEGQRSEYYGLRDFYSLMKIIHQKTKGQDAIALQDITDAFYRNFGGVKTDDAALVDREFRDCVKKLKNLSLLRDEDFRATDTRELLLQNLQSKSLGRNLLLLTNEYSIFGLLDLVLSKKKFEVIFGSSFPRDHNYAEKCRNINRIKLCMENGATVVMLNMREIHESLYDALNQQYVTFGGNFYVDLGLGGHRMKCKVHKDFRLIMIEEKDVVFTQYPVPLINRLEKHHFDSQTLLQGVHVDLKKALEKYAKEFPSKRGKFSTMDDFVGFCDDTVSSILLACPHSFNVEQAQERLLKSATMDSVLRLSESVTFSQKEIESARSLYFDEQSHDSLLQLLKRGLQDIKEKNVPVKYIEVVSFSSMLSESDRKLLLKKLLLEDNSMMLSPLEEFETQCEYEKKLNSFLKYCSVGKGKNFDQPGIFILQCLQAHKHGDLIACAKYSLQNKLREYEDRKGNKKPMLVLFVLLTERTHVGKAESDSLILQHEKETEILYIDEVRPEMSIIGPASMFHPKTISQVYKKGRDAMQKGNEVDCTIHMINACELLKDCRCDAMERIRYPEQNDSRLFNCMEYIKDLFLNRSEVNGSFQKIMLDRMIELRESYEKDMDVKKSLSWVVTECFSKERLQEGGTCRKTILLALKQVTAKLMAYIISLIDINNNLDLLMNSQEGEEWVRKLWLEIFRICPMQAKDLRNVEEFRVQTKQPDKVFKLPFSCEIFEELRYMHEAHGQQQAFVHQMRSTDSYKVLDKALHESAQSVIKAFVNDLVTSEYQPDAQTETDEKQEEVDVIKNIVCRFADKKYKKWKKVVKFQGDFFPKFYDAFNKIKRHLQIISRIFGVNHNIVKLAQGWDDPVDEFTPKAFSSLLECMKGLSEKIADPQKCKIWKNQATEADSIFHDVMHMRTLANEDLRNLTSKWRPLYLLYCFLEQLLPSVSDNELYMNYMNVLAVQASHLCCGPLHSLDKVREFLIILCHVLSRSHEDIRLRLLLNWEDVMCKVCTKRMDEPVQLRCKHILCQNCRKSSVKCPHCSEKIQENFQPTALELTEIKKAELESYKSNCTSFFLVYLSQFCMQDMQEGLPSFLLDEFIKVAGHEELKKDALDLNINFQCCVLTLLADHQKHFDQIWTKLSGESLQRISFVILSNFERKQFNAQKEKSFITHADNTIRQAWLTLTNKTHRGDVAKLKVIAQMRCLISELVFIMSGKRQVEKEHTTDEEAFIIAALDTFMKDESHTLQLFFLKTGCHEFGTDWYRKNISGHQKQRQLVPPFLLNEETDKIIDFWTLLGKSYSDLKTSLCKNSIRDAREIIEQIIDERMTLEKTLAMFAWGLFTKAKAQQQWVLQILMKKQEDGETLSANLVALFDMFLERMSPSQTDHQTFSIFQLAALAIAAARNESRVMTGFATIIRDVSRVNVLFLPTMPEDLYFSVPIEYRTPGNNDYEVDFNDMYTCPNGHMYTIGDCTRAVEAGVCYECGAQVGGIAYDTPAEGNQRFFKEEKTQAGYRLYTEERNMSLAEERLPKSVVSIIRFILHSCMLLGIHRQPLSVKSIFHGRTKKTVVGDLLKELENSLNDFATLTSSNLDDATNLLHQILLDIYNYKTDGKTFPDWGSTEARKAWERKFHEDCLSGILQHMNDRIQSGWKTINETENVCSTALYRLANEMPLEDRESAGEDRKPVTWTNPFFWQNIHHPSITHLKQIVKRDSESQRGEVLKIILSMPNLQLLKHLKCVVDVQSKLVHKYKHELDMTSAEKKMLSGVRKELPELDDLLEEYCEAWKQVYPKMWQEKGRNMECREYFNPINIKRDPIAIALPSSRGRGKVAKLMTEYLVDLQNKFLAKCKEVMRDNFWLEKVELTSLSEDHIVIIDIEKDLMEKIQMHAKYERTYDPEMGAQHRMSYNIDALEKEVKKTYVRHKKILLKESLPCMLYKQDIGLGSDWENLRQRITQEMLPVKILHRVDNLVLQVPNADVYEGVRVLANAIGFLSKVDTSGEMQLRGYIEKTLMLNIKHLMVIPEGTEVKHTLALYRQLSWHKAVKFVLQGLDPYKEAVSMEEQEEIPADLREKTQDSFEKMNINLLQQCLNEILLQVPDFSSDWGLVEDIFENKELLFTKDKNWFAELPKELCFKHITCLFSLAVRFCHQEKK